MYDVHLPSHPHPHPLPTSSIPHPSRHQSYVAGTAPKTCQQHDSSAVSLALSSRLSAVKIQTRKRLKRALVIGAGEPVWPSGKALSPFLTGRMFVRPNMLRTLRRTMIRFLIELLVRRIWFGQSKLYFILNWLVMRCKLRPELAADVQQTA